MSNPLNKYPYHKSLYQPNHGLSSGINGFFKKSYYEGFELGLTKSAIDNRHFSTATRRGWDAGFKKRLLINLVTGKS